MPELTAMTSTDLSWLSHKSSHISIPAIAMKQVGKSTGTRCITLFTDLLDHPWSAPSLNSLTCAVSIHLVISQMRWAPFQRSSSIRDNLRTLGFIMFIMSLHRASLYRTKVVSPSPPYWYCSNEMSPGMSFWYAHYRVQALKHHAPTSFQSAPSS